MIKHVSFDLWNTLLKSNPKFSETRRRILSKISGKQEVEVQDIIRKVSIAHDKEIMETGYHTTNSAGMYERVFRQLGIEPSEDDMEDFIDLMGKVFKLNEPSFICPNTLETLEKVKNKGITMSILSNTGYVESSHIRPFLVKHGISQYMYYNNTYAGMYFSDELGRAKPNPALFSFVAIMHGAKNDEMLHVGDSLIADGGATNIGCQFLEIGEQGIHNLVSTINILNGYLEVEEK